MMSTHTHTHKHTHTHTRARAHAHAHAHRYRMDPSPLYRLEFTQSSVDARYRYWTKGRRLRDKAVSETDSTPSSNAPLRP